MKFHTPTPAERLRPIREKNRELESRIDSQTARLNSLQRDVDQTLLSISNQRASINRLEAEITSLVKLLLQVKNESKTQTTHTLKDLPNNARSTPEGIRT